MTNPMLVIRCSPRHTFLGPINAPKIRLTRAYRWLRRERQQPRRLCAVCLRQSVRHPAGIRRNYTTGRLAGFPVCPRHSDTEAAAALLRYHGIHR